MIKSMTGFGSSEAEIAPLGKATVELRSANHKFLETVFHLPEGFLSLEDKIKKEIDARIRRGRIVCALNVSSGAEEAFINKKLLKQYVRTLEELKEEYRLKDEINLDTLIHLPGVMSLEEHIIPREKIWPELKLLINRALDELVRTRRKEGSALRLYLKSHAQELALILASIRSRFKKAVKEKLRQARTEDEKISFLKDSDITEEIDRLNFHIRNFKHRLSKAGPMGKELDFIAQEMQREANTAGAKSCDALISTKVVQIKSQIEKIREQVQNVE